MGLGDEVLRLGLRQPRHRDLERDRQPEPPAADRADVDPRGDRGAVDDALVARAPRRAAHRVREARGVAGREELLGVRAVAARAAIDSGIESATSTLPSSVRAWPLRPPSVAVATAV